MIYNDLAYFCAVAEHMSFTSAATHLDVPASRISRHIAELEEELGVRLFERTTRQVRLTEEGRLLLDQCQDPINALKKVVGFGERAQQQVLRVTAPVLAARTSIGPKLLDFAELNPGIKIDLTATNVFMDFFREDIDLAFRLGPLKDSGLISRKLWQVPYCFCASAEFVQKHKLHAPIPVEVLLTLPAIVSRQPWHLEREGLVKPKNILHELDDLSLTYEASRRSLGIAMLPSDMVKKGMQEIEITGTKAKTREMYAVYPAKRFLPSRVRLLIDFMAAFGVQKK